MMRESPLLANGHHGPVHHLSRLIHLPLQLHRPRCFANTGFLVCLRKITIEMGPAHFAIFLPWQRTPVCLHACHPCPIIRHVVMPPVYSPNIIHFTKLYIVSPTCKTSLLSVSCPVHKQELSEQLLAPALSYTLHDSYGLGHLPAFTLLHP